MALAVRAHRDLEAVRRRLEPPDGGPRSRPALAARLGTRAGSGPAVVLHDAPPDLERLAGAAARAHRSIAIDVRRAGGPDHGGPPLALAVGGDGAVVAAGHPATREDVEEMVAHARLAEHAQDGPPARHAWGIARPLRFREPDRLPAALDALAGDEALLARLRFADAEIEVHSGGHRIRLDLRRPGGASPPDRVVLWVAPDRARRFWLGELHEPLELLRGALRAQGDLDAMLRFLPALARLSRRLRMLVGEATEEPPRLAVLTRYRVRCATLPGACAVERLAGDDPAECRLLAGLILVGVHPVCRQIELDVLRAAARDEARVREALPDLEAWLRRWLAENATSALFDATPRILSLPEARLELN